MPSFHACRRPRCRIACAWASPFAVSVQRWVRSLSGAETSSGTHAEPTQRVVGLHYFSDAAFKPLRDQFVNSIVDAKFKLCESYVEDLRVNPNRAAGGQVVYMFKIKLLLDALDALGPDDICVISDVDIQFFAEVLPYVWKGITDRDVCFQREFAEMGVNIGFMALRRTQINLAFWQEVFRRVKAEEGFDQRIVNTLLYSGFADRLGLRWGRFPMEIWATTQSFDGPCVHPAIALHHANWIQRNSTTYTSPASNTQRPSGEASIGAANPKPKLAQLQHLSQILHRARASSNNIRALSDFSASYSSDPALALYFRRSFGDLRSGPQWMALPKEHPARPGGSRREVLRRLQQ